MDQCTVVLAGLSSPESSLCLSLKPHLPSLQPSPNGYAYIMLSLSPLFPAWVPLLHVARDGEEEVACSSPLDWHPPFVELFRMAVAETGDGYTLITISQTREPRSWVT